MLRIADDPDELTHHTQAATPGDRPSRWRQIAGNDLQQGRFARAVRAHKCNYGTFTDPKRHLVEQHAAVRQVIADSGKLDVSHGRPW